MSASLGMTYIGLGGRDTVNSLLEEWGEGHRQFLIGGMGGGTPSIPYWRNGGEGHRQFVIPSIP